jgi:hypothetical protein
MDAASDLALRGIRATLRFQGAARALKVLGSIKDRSIGGRAASGVQVLSRRTDVPIAFAIELEVASTQRTVLALSLVPYRYVWLDLFILYHGSSFTCVSTQ